MLQPSFNKSEPYTNNSRHGKFIFEAWKHPETLAMISKIAGVDLVPVMDYEIGHVNMSLPGKKNEYDSERMISEEDDEPIVGWHRDSYPFVCVLMMSDTDGMIGGETALRTGDGEIKKIRGPKKVRKHINQTVIDSNIALGLWRGSPGPIY